MTEIIIADDHPTFRLGLKQVIGRDTSFSLVGEAADGEAAMELVRSKRPQIAVLDWEMPLLNGLEVTKRIRAERLPTQVILLTMHNEDSLVRGAIDWGVCGFVLKDNAVEDILEGLRDVRDGQVYVSPAVARSVLKRNRLRADLIGEKPGLDQLTAMERRVLKFVGQGATTKEIAATLSISPRTVETHRRNICDKLQLHGSHSLMQFAIQNREVL